jgi:hypothetical protein
VIILVLVGSVPKHAPLPVTVSVAVKLPLVDVGVKDARAGLAFCVHEPRPPPPLHALPLFVPPDVAPVIAIAASGVPSQRVISEPADAVGVWPQVIVLVLVGLVPAHAPLPVTVNVAVKEPLVTIGVNVERAGSAFCTQLPRPPPPLHALPLFVPPRVAPVIVIAARGVPSQRFIAAPAEAVGVCPQVIVLVLVGFEPKHPSFPVTVKVAVNVPFVAVGVNTARAGFTSCVQLPRPPPPLHVLAL